MEAVVQRPTEGASFRLSCKSFFLTYPHCDAKAEVFKFLTTQKLVPVYCKVAQEQHQDGSPHLHALIVYGSRRDISSSRSFDFGIFHPNIARTLFNDKADEYISKSDPAPLVFGSLPRVATKSDSGKGPSRDMVMFDLYDSSATKEEFLAKVRSTMTYTYFTNLDRLSSAADSVFKPAPKIYQDPFVGHPWLLPGAVKKWLREEFNKPERAKALCLIGPSRYGKTAWARSLGHHIFWRQSTNLDTWNEEAKYLIIDDIDWKFLSNKKCWLTAMGENTVTDRYRPKRDIVNYKPCIYLCNPDQDPRNFFENGEGEYWDANITFVTLSRSLINPNADKLDSILNDLEP